MATLTLLRHGETSWSATGRHTGRTDVPLTPRGEQQARALGALLAGTHFALVLTSPRVRARETARLAGLTSAQVDDHLAEWDYGGYEGRTTAEIIADRGAAWTVFTDGVPSGETLDEVAQRARVVLARARPVLDDGADVALVGHGHHLRVLAACWLDLAPAAGALLQLRAGTLSRLGHEHGVATINLWNATPPLC